MRRRKGKSGQIKKSKRKKENRHILYAPQNKSIYCITRGKNVTRILKCSNMHKVYTFSRRVIPVRDDNFDASDNMVLTMTSFVVTN